MAQQKRWEPPPFLLKKSQQQLDEEAEKNKPIDMRPGKWQPPSDLGIMIGGKPIDQPKFDKEKALNDLNAQEAEDNTRDQSVSLLERIYDAGNKGAFDYLPESLQRFRPKELYKKATEGIKEFGESGGEEDTFTNRVKKVARYGQAFGETFSGGIEEALNPINLGLMAISGGSSAAFKAGKGAKDAQTAQKLYQIGKALEFPGKVASGAMVAHGGYKGATGDTWEERVGGGIEAVLGATGLRFKSKYKKDFDKEIKNVTPPKTPVNTGVQHGPQEQLKFPLPRTGNVNPIEPGKFSSGPRGTYKEGDIIAGELGDMPTSAAYNYGNVVANKSGKPFVYVGNGGPESSVKPEINTVKLEAIRQYMKGMQEDKIPKGTTFDDYWASIQSAEKPIIAEPNKPISFDEILPPDKGNARYSGYMEGYEELPGFHQFNVPTENGGLTTIAESEALKRGYDIPEKRIPNQNVDPYSGPIEGEQILSDLPDLNGSTLMTGERVRDLLQVEPSQAVADGLVEIDQSQGTTSYRMLPDVRQPVLEGEVLPPEPTFDMFGKPNDRDLTDLEVEEIKAQQSQMLMDSYGEDTIEGQRALDEVNGIIDTTATIPDVRQLPDPIQSIGEGIIDPTTNEPITVNFGSGDPLEWTPETIADMNEYPTEEFLNRNKTNQPRASDQWQEIVDELDARNASDSEYRNILSTGSKDPLKKRETWRDRVQKYIQLDRERDIPESDKYPTEMRVPGESGNIAMGGASPKALDALATALYGKERPSVISKELLQNANDEHNIAKINKPIKILMNYAAINPATKVEERSITVRDYGRGMTTENLYTVFTDIGETGKGGEEIASGGFGFAKAAPMLAGNYVRATTIVKEGNKNISYTFEGNPKQLKDQTYGVPLKRKETMLPTGTQVTTWFPKKQGLDNATRLVKNTVMNSPGIKSGVILTENYMSDSDARTEDEIADFLNDVKSSKSRDPIMEHELLKPIEQPPIQDSITSKGANVDIRYNPPGAEVENQGYKLHILNKGLYQSTVQHGYYGPRALPNAPEDIIIDVHATVEEGQEGYPFTLNRESLADEVISEVKSWITRNIISGAQEKMRTELQNSYDNLAPVIPFDRKTNRPLVTNRPSVIMDQGSRLYPDELSIFQETQTIHKLVELTDHLLEHILDRVAQPAWSLKLQKTGMLLRTGVYGIHVPNPAEGYQKSAIMINHLMHIEQQSSPMEAAIGMVITGMHEVAHLGISSGSYANQISAQDLKDPRIGEYLQLYLQHTQEQGGLNEAHDVEFIKRLSEVFTTLGPESMFGVADEFHAAITDPHTGGYSREVQDLLQIYTSSRGRPETKTDILGPTGVHQDPTNGRKGNNGSPIEPDGDGITRGEVEGHSTQTIAASVGRLKQALVAGQLARNKQDSLVSLERGKRAGRIAGVKTRGMEGYYQQLGMLAGPMPKAQMDSIITNQDMNVLVDAISDNGELRPYQEISAKRGLVKLLMGDAPQNSEMALLTQVFGDGELSGLVELHAGIGGIGGNRRLVNNILHLAKTMKASSDLSGSLRQGLPFIDRKEYWKAFWNMHKYFGSEVSYQAGLEAMRSHPDFDLIMETPLFLAGFKGQGMGQNDSNVLANREEQFLSEWGDHIPIVKQSQRAYVGFLDETRFHVLVSLLNDMRKLGIPVSQEIKKFEGTKREITQTISTPELDEVAKFVNIFSGRGSLGRFEKMAVEANVFLWSPKFLSSRLTILNPAYYIKASPFVQKQALRSLFTIAGAGLTMLGLAKMMGAEVEYEDATSADFMKAKFGNTRFDPWSSLQQNIVAEMRILTYIHNAGKFIRGKPISKNQKYRPGSGYNTRTARDVAIDFAENKESPLVNFISSLADLGKSYEPSGASKLLTDDWNLLPTNRVSKEIINLYSPMMIDTIIDLVKDDPSLLPLGMNSLTSKALPLSIASAYGGSVQTYDHRIPGGQYRPRVPRLVP